MSDFFRAGGVARRVLQSETFILFLFWILVAQLGVSTSLWRVAEQLCSQEFLAAKLL